MKKTILITSLLFCILSTPSYAQSTKENTTNENLGTNTVQAGLPTGKESLPAGQGGLSTEQVGLPAREAGANTQQKRTLTPDDYCLWETLSPMKKISDNGQWVSYSIEYSEGKDTLFIKDVNKNTLYTIPDGRNGTFSAKNDWVAYSIKGKGIGYMDLKTGQRTLVPGATKYSFTKNGNYLAIFSSSRGSEKEKRNTLLVKNLIKGTTLKIENVSAFGFNAKGNRLVYFAKNGKNNVVALRHLNKDFGSETILTSSTTNNYHRLTWNKEDSSFAFLEAFKDSRFKEESHIVHQYRGDKLYSFDHRKKKGFPKDMCVSPTTFSSKFLISNDTERVFFGIAPWSLVQGKKEDDTDKDNDPKVQIWHWKDKEVYPSNQDYYSKTPKLSVWWSGTDRFKQIASTEQPEVVLTGDQMHALSFYPRQYRPIFKYGGDYRDIYITDLTTGKKELFLKKQLYDHQRTLTSPEGNYISYFRDRNWWVYDIKTKAHTNITKKLPYPTYQEKYTTSRSPLAYGKLGWTKNDKEVIIHDAYDIWLVAPDGSSQKKLTQGRKSKIRHRIYEHHYKDYIQEDFFGFEAHSFNPDEGFIISTYGKVTKKSGYSIWRPKKGVQKIIFGNKHIDRLKKAKNRDIYITQEQRFDSPPKVLLYSKKENVGKTIIQSNPQHKQFHWGRSELVEYTGINGKTLQGALFYPANYQPNKKYPMVVHIYQRLSEELHYYINPSLQTGSGFNPTLYAANGYFVLLPDIEYEYNDPGVSATKCVVSAVEKVIELGLVNKKAIGLLGGSFGGYETAFIITQTDLFAAARSGVAASIDLISSYFSLFHNGSRSEVDFFETSQMRFTGSFYQYREEYLRNSPIHNLQNVNTPLLSYYGAKDSRVNISQGIELYNAMRRLGKEHVFLNYPTEEHVFMDSANQTDLSKRTMHWFDHKLKGAPAEDWILKGENE